MKIAVGSQNKAKLAAIQNAALTYWPQSTVAGYDVPSGVSDQPMTLQETLTGATNRAHAALQAGKPQGATIGVGLEGGLVQMRDFTVLFGIVTITDGTTTASAPTTGTPHPASWTAPLEGGEELGPFIAKKFPDYTKTIGARPFLTGGQLLREEVFTEAAKGAFAPWVKPAAFAETSEKPNAA
jgi:inosine/xanthosine triphosphatase